MPPLTIPDDALEEGLHRIEDAVLAELAPPNLDVAV
jgi:hypothetical protein